MLRRSLVALILLLISAAACGSEDELDATVTSIEPGASAVGAPIPGGGLTVAEALASDLNGPLQVHGALLIGEGTMTLCERLEESSPPGCSGASIEVRGLDTEGVALRAHGDVRWLDDISVLGDVDGGILTVSTTSN